MRIPSVFKSLLLLSLFCFGLTNNAIAGDLLNLGNLEITEKNPATFVLYNLKEGDQIGIDYSRITGDIRSMRIEVISVSGTEPIPIFQYTAPGQEYEIEEDGVYYFRFSTNNDVRIRLVIYNTSPEPENGMLSKFKFDSKVLETNNQVEQLKFVFNLQANDQVSFSSSDQKSLFLKVLYQQGAELKSLGTGANFTIPNDASCTFIIYIDKDDPNIQDRIKQKVLKIFGKKDLGFKDIHVSIYRPPQASASVPGNQMSGTQSQQGNTGPDFSGLISEMQNQQELRDQKEAELQERMNAIQQKAQRSQDEMLEMQRLNMEYQKLQDEKREEEQRQLFKRLSAAQMDITARPMHQDNDFFSVYPKNHFSGGDIEANKITTIQRLNNKVCKPIRVDVQVTEENMESVAWFFMVYVGERDTMSNYIETTMQGQIGLHSEKSIWEQYAINLHHQFTPKDGNWRYYEGNIARTLTWPDERQQPWLFSEDVSYAIVKGQQDVMNYLTGQWYLPVFESFDKKIHLMYLQRPVVRDEYYFCVTNDNLYTPVDVTFYYFMIEALNKNTNAGLYQLD